MRLNLSLLLLIPCVLLAASCGPQKQKVVTKTTTVEHKVTVPVRTDSKDLLVNMTPEEFKSIHRGTPSTAMAAEYAAVANDHDGSFDVTIPSSTGQGNYFFRFNLKDTKQGKKDSYVVEKQYFPSR